jgi:hypothetical protein
VDPSAANTLKPKLLHFSVTKVAVVQVNDDVDGDDVYTVNALGVLHHVFEIPLEINKAPASSKGM